ncbi:MAG: hypothetical protein LBR06_00425 [Bacteroidales bacterium]|jgi:hypothetical protein|nr:hypothetical protein [Bacteroidales bacterium]
MTKFLCVFAVTAGLVAIAIAGMAIKILLKRNGRFPDTHIGNNPEMRKRGIKCVQEMANE